MVSERVAPLGHGDLRVPAREDRAALDLGRRVHCLFGLVFDDIGLDAATQHLRDCAAQGERCFLSTPNLNFAIAAQGDPAFRGSVLRSDLSVVDGMTILRLARLLGLPMRERVAGSDLFERLRSPVASGQKPITVYFFGGPPGVAQRAAERLNGEGGGLRCVGFESPGFGSVAELSDAATISRINAAGADFLVVALGAKKGQAWIEHNRLRLQAPLISHLGAVINFVAGSVQRAPPWVQQSGFEWLWRIKEEPALWRRYAADAMALGRVLVTEVTPSLWRAWRSGPVSAEAGRIETRQHDGLTTLMLHGRFTGEALGPLRLAIAQALRQGTRVQLDLRGTTQIDNAFLAIAMLLDGWQSAPRAVIPGSAFDAGVRDTVARFGAQFLIEP